MCETCSHAADSADFASGSHGSRLPSNFSDAAIANLANLANRADRFGFDLGLYFVFDVMFVSIRWIRCWSDESCYRLVYRVFVSMFVGFSTALHASSLDLRREKGASLALHATASRFVR